MKIRPSDLRRWRDAARSWWPRLLDHLEPAHRPMRNPLEFCLGVILGISVAPVAVGIRPLPNSLENSLPDNLGQLSAALLVLGCAGLVMGIAWRNRDMGIVIQQSSMWLVMASLFTYGMALGVATQWESQGAYAGGVCFGLAVGFGARIGQLQLWFRRRGRLAAHL